MLLAVPAALLTAPAAAASPFYLALGDSVPVWNGTQSYPYLVRAHVAHRLPGVGLQNLAVSGETTGSMLAGQYARALTALRNHRGRVALITIDIGGNDVVACAINDYPSPGPASRACWSDAFSRLAGNLTRMLRGLRAAAPGVPIIGMTYYNPLLGNWLAGGTIRATVLAEQTHLVDLNRQLTRLYGGTRWTADVEGAFHARDLRTFVSSPWGRVPLGVARACAWLDIFCRAGSIEGFGDDPNARGATAIARAFNARIDGVCRLRGAVRRWLLCHRAARSAR